MKTCYVKYSSYTAFFLIVLASGIFAIMMGKDANWDLKNYHYYNGYAFLAGRLEHDIAPAQMQTYLNPLFDIFVFLGMKYINPELFGFILGSFQGVSIWLVYMLTRSMTREYSVKVSISLAFISAAAAFCGAGWFSEIGGTMGDNVVSVFVLFAIYLVLTTRTPISFPEGKRILVVSGFFLGMGAGLKLVAAIYFVGFVFALPFLVEIRELAKHYFLILVSFVAGFATAIGFWMIKLWDKFQSPLFPYYNNIFRSNYADQSNYTDMRFMPDNLLQKFFYPFYFSNNSLLVSEINFTDYRFVTLYIVIIIFILWFAFSILLTNSTAEVIFSGKRKVLFLITFSIMSYTAWQIIFSIYRYLIALELLIPLVIISVVGTIIRKQKYSAVLSILVLTFLIFTVNSLNWGRLPWDNQYISLTSNTPLSKFSNSTIVLSGFNPTSYVIPFFPSDANFIRINSNFHNPNQKTIMREMINNAILQSNDLKVLLTHDRNEIEALSAMKIAVVESSCVRIDSSFGDKFSVCVAILNN